jgi:hypothetical protein
VPSAPSDLGVGRHLAGDNQKVGRLERTSNRGPFSAKWM